MNCEEKKETVRLEEIQPESQPVIAEPVDAAEESLDGFIPGMVMNAAPEQQEQKCIISDERLLGVYDKVMGYIEEDRQQLSGYVDNFAEMVINDGDSTPASKEALVNLIKAKTDLADKMTKIADLMTRLKQKNTYAYSGPHMHAQQTNNINIGAGAERRELIKEINLIKKKKKGA